MGSGMSKILPGLYVGNFRDAKDAEQLKTNKVSHILSIHDNAKKILQDKEYLCLIASDSPSEDLIRFFPQCIDFIHKARLEGEGVVVHCLAGVSRSVTVTAAYIMTVTNLGWRDALNAIRGARDVANPNFGFQKQLQDYEVTGLEKARQQLKEKYPDNPFQDEADCRQLLQCFKHYVQTGETTSSMSRSAKADNSNDGLYPLPHNAYSSKRQSALNPDTSLSSSVDRGLKPAVPTDSAASKLSVSDSISVSVPTSEFKSVTVSDCVTVSVPTLNSASAALAAKNAVSVALPKSDSTPESLPEPDQNAVATSSAVDPPV